MRYPPSAAAGNDANQYSCKIVSWEETQSGMAVGGGVSCLADTRLCEKSGNALLYTCRPDNWNGKLGRVSADNVVIVVGNHQAPSPYESSERLLHPITLASFLKLAGRYAAYTGVDGDKNLFDATLDKEVLIRFQTVFLPAHEVDPTEFCAETFQISDQSNAFVLCTTQGVAFQHCGAGVKKMFHHSIDSNGQGHSHWMKAKSSLHAIDGVDVETREETTMLTSRGKVTTASAVGIRAMGSRFNALMMVQIPLLPHEPDLPCGESVATQQPIRDPSQHVILTIVTYNTVAGGVPLAEDIRAAIEDMEQLYAACSSNQNGKQASQEATCTKSDPSVSKPNKKIKWQSYHPPTRETQNASAFLSAH